MVADSFPSLTYRRRYLPLPARGTIKPRNRIWIGVAIAAIPLTMLYSGLLVRVVVNTIDEINEDFIVGDIMHNHVDKLKFTVAGRDYEVRTPNITLTDRQREAWFHYAARRKFPVYAVDGPLAIDP